MVQKLRPFYWRGGFGLLVELHREGSAPAACAAGLFLEKRPFCNSAVMWIAVVWYMTWKCSDVQGSVVLYRTVLWQCSAVQDSTVVYSFVQCCTVQNSLCTLTVLYSAVGCNVQLYSTVQSLAQMSDWQAASSPPPPLPPKYLITYRLSILPHCTLSLLTEYCTLYSVTVQVLRHHIEYCTLNTAHSKL